MRKPGPSMSRARFLKSAGAVVGSGLALAGGSSTALAAPRSPGAERATARRQQRDVESTKIGNLTGPGLTTRFRMEGTDLGVPTVTPDGRKLFIFGDSFEDACPGCGWWRSPTGLYSTTSDLSAGIEWSEAVGGDTAQQLWDYEHDNGEYSTILPSDIITIGDSMYLHAMANAGLGNVVWAGIWRSDDNGATWVDTGARFPGDLHDGLFQLFTWEQGEDGYVYVFSTEFTRSKPMILHRVPTEELTNPDAYEPWGYQDGEWAWGNPPTPVLDGKFGEMCLRRIDGHWVLTFLNIQDGQMDGMMMDSPTDDLTQAYRTVLLWGAEWGEEDDAHVAQMYGPYIIPGSTLDDLHLTISQWNTEKDWPYHVMQFRFTGFGG